MSSRHAAARPKRAGEDYARAHHGQTDTDEGSDSKKVKFDMRNPSALAPGMADDEGDADEPPDAFLEADADVIRGSAAMKRGAVNIDGYDSDSDREELGASRASKSKGQSKKDDDVDDMFAEEDDEGADKDETVDDLTGKKKKEVKFMDQKQIQGQEHRSKSGGHIRLDDEEESDEEDEEAVELAIQEEGVDEEVGLGGLKKHAPKVEAFNLKQEEEEGRFDEAGNFVRKAADRDAQHDRWMEGISKKDMRKAAEAHEKRETEMRIKRREEDSILTADLLKALILRLEPSETALEALARLGKGQAKTKRVPKWKQKKQQKDSMEVDDASKESSTATAEDPAQVKIKEAIAAITDAADKLLGRDRPDVYDRERELLIREWSRETQERWNEPSPEPDNDATAAADAATRMWEYRWTDGRDEASKQGPYDGAMMKVWQDAGYFGEGVEFRAVGDEGWSRVVSFV
jgi:CD2 antigen cytoplasmic tail-binding protein 2